MENDINKCICMCLYRTRIKYHRMGLAILKQERRRNEMKVRTTLRRLFASRYVRRASFVVIVYSICLGAWHDSITLEANVIPRSSQPQCIYIGYSSDFRRGFVCSQSFAAVHQRYYRNNVVRFSCCETLRPQLRKHDSAQRRPKGERSIILSS